MAEANSASESDAELHDGSIAPAVFFIRARFCNFYAQTRRMVCSCVARFMKCNTEFCRFSRLASPTRSCGRARPPRSVGRMYRRLVRNIVCCARCGWRIRRSSGREVSDSKAALVDSRRRQLVVVSQGESQHCTIHAAANDEVAALARDDARLSSLCAEA